MRADWLNQLQGMTVENARKVVEDAGHIAFFVPEGMSITAVVRPNTVILWQLEEKVLVVQAGDPNEIED